MLQVLLKPLFDLGALFSELGELFKIAKFKNHFFEKLRLQPYNFFVFWATTTIHTFLKSSEKL